MRISDWSSDVCSSDLKTVLEEMPVIRQAIVGRGDNVKHQVAFERKLLAIRKQTQNPLAEIARKQNLPELSQFYMPSFSSRTVVYKGLLLAGQVGSFYADLRSEEHTSELQSLMRISYAVFC